MTQTDIWQKLNRFSKNAGWIFQKSVQLILRKLKFWKISGWVFKDLPIWVKRLNKLLDDTFWHDFIIMYTLEFQRGDLTRTREVQIIYSRLSWSISKAIYKQVSQLRIIVYNLFFFWVTAKSELIRTHNLEIKLTWKYDYKVKWMITWKLHYQLWNIAISLEV